MKVNELAKQVGVEPHVIRYYSRIGLLLPVRDNHNGYKLYDAEDARRLEFIRQAQSLGLTLTEISELLAQHEQEGCDCCQLMYQMLENHVEQNRRKIEELKKLQVRMETALADWNDKGAPGCTGSPACPTVMLDDCSTDNH